MPPAPEDFGSDRTTNKTTNINTWLQIGAALLMLGSIFGTFMVNSQNQEKAQVAMEATMKANQEESNRKLENINTKIADFHVTTQKHDFLLTALTGDFGKYVGQLEANRTDDERQWETIRQTEAKANGAVQKVDFLEWRIQLERKNPNVISPPLQSQQ